MRKMVLRTQHSKTSSIMYFFKGTNKSGSTVLPGQEIHKCYNKYGTLIWEY